MTVQVREYIDPTIGVATLDVTLTVMVGTGDEKTQEYIINKTSNYNLYSLCTVISMVMDADSIALSSVALHVYVPA